MVRDPETSTAFQWHGEHCCSHERVAMVAKHRHADCLKSQLRNQHLQYYNIRRLVPPPLPGVPQQPDSDFHQGPARLSAAYSLTHTQSHTHTHSLTHSLTHSHTHTHSLTRTRPRHAHDCARAPAHTHQHQHVAAFQQI